ncbi:NAD(P)H azoreductase [Maliponia aquimaris]|uniref:Divinyl chlorophyllide a 8-vinyl-reductase, chloroplastic n=1 Tax=Maliponia aquimaris TaxID=1673631 RepID=A0A238JRE0_9RHOB|nr:NAD(P)H azoreductase [Maliponia aquimaris]
MLCPLRPGAAPPVAGCKPLTCNLSDADSLRSALAGERIETVISCIASRSGTPRDAWAVDHDAQVRLLDTARAAGARRFVLLSAICVQKPRLPFQFAKLAFEARLRDSGLDWSIVRPTAFFKSLSGQVARVQAGKPFLLFGDGLQTACKPISDADLARYIVGCLDDPARRNRILPIGGPGPAITPRDQGERLFAMLGRPARFRQVPFALMDGIAATLGALGRVSPRLAAKADLARIGRYYATESMLHWDEDAGRYDAAATPEFGTDTLWDHYARMIRGEVTADLGAHAVF